MSSEWSGGRSCQSGSMTQSQSSVASTTPSEMLGTCGGGSALTPAELRAAETAERLLEQERRDMEIARQLQVCTKNAQLNTNPS